MRAAAAVLAVALLAGCGGGGSGGAAAPSDEPCGDQDTPVGGGAVPPALELPADAKLLRVASQGRTVVVFTSTAGGRDDLVAIRDRTLEHLTSKGSTVVGTDQEPGAEAEAEVAGTFDGTLRVTPLCAGRVEVRYKVEG